jgi:hypothetical protein
MAISNELSSEIASAILAAKHKSPEELRILQEIVMKVHYTLQEMSIQARSQSRRDDRDSKGSLTDH